MSDNPYLVKLDSQSDVIFSFFNSNELLGELKLKDNKLVFEGDVDSSAKIFFDSVIHLIEARIREEIK